MLKGGARYYIVDSDEATWSYNSQSDNRGFFEIRGVYPYTGGTTTTQPAGVSVSISGRNVQWTDAAPFIDANNRTLVPLRAVGEALCAVSSAG